MTNTPFEKVELSPKKTVAIPEAARAHAFLKRNYGLVFDAELGTWKEYLWMLEVYGFCENIRVVEEVFGKLVVGATFERGEFAKAWCQAVVDSGKWEEELAKLRSKYLAEMRGQAMRKLLRKIDEGEGNTQSMAAAFKHLASVELEEKEKEREKVKKDSRPTIPQLGEALRELESTGVNSANPENENEETE